MADIALRRDDLDPPPPTASREGDAAPKPRRRKVAPTAEGRPRARSGTTRPRRPAPPPEPAPAEVPAAEAPAAGRADARARNAAAALTLDALSRLLERALAAGAAAADRGAAGRPALAPFTAERPRAPVAPATAPAPDPDDPPYRPALGLLGRLLPGLRRARVLRAEEVFRRDYTAWVAAVERIERDHTEAMRRHADRLAAWEAERRAHTEAVRRLCGRVLAPRAGDPACLPHAVEVGHDADARVTVIDYRLPQPADLPTLKRVRYVQARGTMEEVRLKPEELNRLYDAVVCRLALRALHDLFEADPAGALGAVVFNGWIEAADDAGAPGAGGVPARACILSVRAERRVFRALDLTKADPWACYRALDGVGGARPHRLVPVAPLVTAAGEGEGHRMPVDATDHHAPADAAPRPAPTAEKAAARLVLAAT